MKPVEEQIRLLVRAWPIPDRIERGDEIVGTTLDLLPDGSTRLSAHLAVNLVAGGLRARWRLRPPVWRWLYYRSGGTLPGRWHRWMMNDLYGPGWRRRMVVSRLVIGFLACLVGSAAAEILLRQPIGSGLLLVVGPALLGMTVGGLAFRRFRTTRDRDLLLTRHGYRPPVEGYPAWPPPTPSAPGHRPIPE